MKSMFSTNPRKHIFENHWIKKCGQFLKYPEAQSYSGCLIFYRARQSLALVNFFIPAPASGGQVWETAESYHLG